MPNFMPQDELCDSDQAFSENLNAIAGKGQAHLAPQLDPIALDFIKFQPSIQKGLSGGSIDVYPFAEQTAKHLAWIAQADLAGRLLFGVEDDLQTVG